MATQNLVSEPQALAPLLAAARLTPPARGRVVAHTRRLVEAVRNSAASGGIEAFLQEYRLSTPEGIALLSLAESLPRVPDEATAKALIHDKLSAGDWHAHAGASPSRLVNIATRALTLSQGFVRTADTGQGVMARLLEVGGEPLLQRAMAAAMTLMGEHFVMGRSIEEAVADMDTHYRYSFDMLGEAALTGADAARHRAAYRHAIRYLASRPTRVGDDAPDISIKLSALHPRYEEAQRQRILRELTGALLELTLAARDAGIGVTIDAEEAERLELSLDVITRVLSSPELTGYEQFGLAVQAYQKRARPLIDWIEALGQQLDRRLRVRLVKGAYWDTEIKRAQERGLEGYPVFTRKAATDVSYLACARAMLDARRIFPAFATHNALTVATVLEWVGSRRDVEFQRLFGMGTELYEALIAEGGPPCRIYAPVGVHRDLLAYLARRLLENSANTSFVNRVSDSRATFDELVADPVEHLETVGCAPHPRIPLPCDLFGERRNSQGIDLNDPTVVEQIGVGLAQAMAQPHSASPLIGGRDGVGTARPVTDPADRQRGIGTVIEATAADIEPAMAMADRAAESWAARSIDDRARCLERAADLLEDDREVLWVLAIREGGKTIPDAIAELREAVDYCRFYAQEARRRLAPVLLPGPTGEHNRLTYSGRGVFVCISPWNFPLAIFIGQVAAALVAGNAVVAKPAPQTPLIAHRAIKILHAAGIPLEVLHLLPGGSDIGKLLIADRRTAGIAFTGSTAAARDIVRTLAAQDGPIVPLIAETGGQNAMIVDSSALPEQVVRDVLTSAFRSAGQRCSALRVLYLQDEIAPVLIDMLTGAMAELMIGDPRRIETDIGPIIDEAAPHRLQVHIDAGIGKIVYRVLPGKECEVGYFFGPTLLEIDRVDRLTGEVFGPIIHIIRWHADRLDDVVDQINGTEYGLTLGIHSRIDRTIDAIVRRVRVGNIYVNRSMVSAVVGSQPFGGEGLSGTGPKAGGPNYLMRFATERMLSIDTTAVGGNADLISLAETTANR
ncbi:MAG: bifunctional proline dehydrogenase/L-glutamate gamma-semialdehyde dehydrogenase PutA [Alphaproteobacteria bacterium]|nr:bifunctional proline dehydrogenase/L-glutamate gamma-semialdehyde dehydrogenase PutA [Alphaproteobacteria bacterium]